jgi:hypothetical protein
MKESIIVSIGLLLIAIIVVFGDFYTQGKVYDCTLAEISPDYPIEIKHECRRLLKEYYEKEKLLHI